MSPKTNEGFTLLEVMIALTIMTIAFSAILTSQSGSIFTTTKTKELNFAGWLARDKMVESEHLYEGKPFSELPKEASEAFPKPFERFKWKREIREVKFPDFSVPQKNGESAIPEPIRILTKVITKYLNDSVREMVVTVTWERGKGEQKVQISTYLVDMESEFNFSI